jgi:energy-coupling factor transporter transmembrane protein EcfT
MVSSLRASENVARALEARAFGAPGVRRSYLVDLAFRPVDWLLLVLLGLGAGAILLLYFRFGFGADPLRLLS